MSSFAPLPDHVLSDRYVGLMSGTSLDGVDAVLVDFASGWPVLVGETYLPYPADLRAELLALHEPVADELHRSQCVALELAGLYAQAVVDLLSRLGLDAGEVAAIGCHGQTIRHRPECGYTVQLNAPALLAELTGIRVVADFRMRDIAAGGQGAPLVPAFHAGVFGREVHRVVVNVGGISNLTDLHPQRAVRGWDCGPGNLLMDGWIARHRGEAFDAGGDWAASGQVLPDLLAALRAHPFFTAPHPKSAGREQFNLPWLDSLLCGTEDPADVQATLLALTVAAIADAIREDCGMPAEVLICGGGAHNQALVAGLAAALPASRVQPTDVHGIAADWLEGMAFAWLARQCLLRRPGNLPAVTGAQGLRVLGAVYPA